MSETMTRDDAVQLPISLRDWFAGQALPGMIHELGDEESEHPADWDEFNTSLVAKAAYRYADAMLKAREARHD